MSQQNLKIHELKVKMMRRYGKRARHRMERLFLCHRQRSPINKTFKNCLKTSLRMESSQRFALTNNGMLKNEI